jgi:hypothetical protein
MDNFLEEQTNSSYLTSAELPWEQSLNSMMAQTMLQVVESQCADTKRRELRH